MQPDVPEPATADGPEDADAQFESVVPDGPETLRWKLPLALFVATVCSTFYVGAAQALNHPPEYFYDARRAQDAAAAWRAFFWAVGRGWVFAVPLLAILLCHEFGHYLMARRHRVRASLPMFIPFPNLFGTMGAVIAMKGRIKTRDALVDIGAAGPLAGLAVAIPVTVLGLSLSTVQPIAAHPDALIEGDSLLYLGLKRAMWGAIPPGHDMWLHPVAFAGWAGFFVTMMNLLPVGQLDGGHVAYALFGVRADRWSRLVSYGLLALAAGVAAWLWRTNPRGLDFATLTPATVWCLWALLSRGVMKLSGDRHPPTSDEPLSPGRRRAGVFTLVCFFLLFMPLPIQQR